MAFSGKPIRVGLIGLNATYPGEPTGTSWAAAAHLPYLKWSPKYEIVALQNSSVARARESIKQYALPIATKAYETPEDLANDPDVDLVVSSIRVDKHAASVIPSIEAGKAVFVEWPLESNLPKVQALADLVDEYKVKNMVGAQGKFSIVARQLSQLINTGVIGELRSSNMFAQTPWGGPKMPAHVDYFIEKDVGGNIFTIGFGHMMEIITSVLGQPNEHSSLLVNHYPAVDIIKSATDEVVKQGCKNTSPDQIMFNAMLGHGVAFNFHLQCGLISPKHFASSDGTSGKAFPHVGWRIFGDKGEIRVTSPCTWPLNTGNEDFHIELLISDEGSIDEEQRKQVKQALNPEDELEDLPKTARNIGRLYEAFAEKESASGPAYPTFRDALKKHQLIEDMYKQSGF